MAASLDETRPAAQAPTRAPAAAGLGTARAVSELLEEPEVDRDERRVHDRHEAGRLPRGLVEVALEAARRGDRARHRFPVGPVDDGVRRGLADDAVGAHARQEDVLAGRLARRVVAEEVGAALVDLDRAALARREPRDRPDLAPD